MAQSFKIALIGSSGVGKTSFIYKLLNCEDKPRKTIGVDVHQIKLNIDGKNVCFNVWDRAGDPKIGGLRDGYFINSDAAIVMGDEEIFNNQDTIRNNIRSSIGCDNIVFLKKHFSNADLSAPFREIYYRFLLNK